MGATLQVALGPASGFPVTSALPLASTATQRVLEGQDTELRAPAASISRVLQLDPEPAPGPVSMSASPPVSTATQSAIDAHEIALGVPAPPSGIRADQLSEGVAAAGTAARHAAHSSNASAAGKAAQERGKGATLYLNTRKHRLLRSRGAIGRCGTGSDPPRTIVCYLFAFAAQKV
jgi:hypothetical protein